MKKTFNNSLEVEGLVKKYDSFKLGPVSFSIQGGEIVGFIGRNGAGKTTTLKSIYNLVLKNEGSVKIFGEEFSQNETDIKQGVGFMLGGVDFYAKTKIKKITEVVKRFYKEWDEDLYRKYLKDFSLDENKRVAELSEGMKVKYNLALALSHHASLLILDEPTSGLDPISRDEVTDIFTALTEDHKTSILFSTHITEDLEKCADRIIYIKEGQIIEDEELSAFKNKYLLIKGNKDDLTEKIKTLSVSYRVYRKEFEALFLRKDEELIKEMNPTIPDLETIMVLSERSDKDAESNL